MKEKILAAYEVNTGRQKEFDIGKAVIIFFMAIVHVAGLCAGWDSLEDVTSVGYFLDSVVGGPFGAPLFMFAMGLGIAYSRGNDWNKLVKRGIRIYLLGFVLNIVRYIIPYYITYLLTGNYDFYIKNLVGRFFNWDILTFAGLALILVGIMKRLGRGIRDICILSLIMSFIGSFIELKDFGPWQLNVFLGMFVGTADDVMELEADFPLFNWFIFVAFGLAYGYFYRRLKDKKTYYRYAIPAGFIIGLIPVFIEVFWEVGMMGAGEYCFFHMKMYDALTSLALNIAVIGVYYYIAEYLPEGLMRLLGGISRDINSIYCIQWVFISGIIVCALYSIKGDMLLPWYIYVPIGCGISILSIACAFFYEYIKGKLVRRDDKNGYKS